MHARSQATRLDTRPTTPSRWLCKDAAPEVALRLTVLVKRLSTCEWELTHSHIIPLALDSIDFAVADRVPGIPFSLGKSWAGNLPISDKKHDPNQLFFWLFPPSEGVGHDDVVVWLNGGPGCSSLEGLFQENGPFKFPFNSTKVEKNPWSWTRLSWVLWVEQPVTVGLTKGKSDITNEVDVAREFTGFLKNFFKTFDHLQGKKFWLTGESYA